MYVLQTECSESANLLMPCFGVGRRVMSDEKGLFEEEKEVELLKKETSSMEEEEMAEEKPAVERSDRGEFISIT